MPRKAARDRTSLTMLGWGLNEEQNVRGYIERAERLLSAHATDFELILFDDGSTDRTWEIASECARTRPWLLLVKNERNLGPAFCTKQGFQLATKDYVFWQTCDWAYDIDLLISSLQLLEDHDVLQGVRLGSLSPRGIASARSDNLRKGVISAVNYLLIRLLFRLPLHDYQNVTVYPRELVLSLDLESNSSFTNAELLLKSWWKGASFQEVPVRFIKRTVGKGKGTSIRRILQSVQDILHWWCRWVVLGRRADFGRGTVSYWQEPSTAVTPSIGPLRPARPILVGTDDRRKAA